MSLTVVVSAGQLSSGDILVDPCINLPGRFVVASVGHRYCKVVESHESRIACGAGVVHTTAGDNGIYITDVTVLSEQGQSHDLQFASVPCNLKILREDCGHRDDSQCITL